jgi:hypothetical protein
VSLAAGCIGICGGLALGGLGTLFSLAISGVGGIVGLVGGTCLGGEATIGILSIIGALVGLIPGLCSLAASALSAIVVSVLGTACSGLCLGCTSCYIASIGSLACCCGGPIGVCCVGNSLFLGGLLTCCTLPFWGTVIGSCLCGVVTVPPLLALTLALSPCLCCFGWIGLPCLIGGGFCSLLGCNLTQPWWYPIQRTCFGSLCPPGDILAIDTLCSQILCFGLPPSCGATALRTGLETIVGVTPCGLITGAGNTTCSSTQSLVLAFCGMGWLGNIYSSFCSAGVTACTAYSPTLWLSGICSQYFGCLGSTCAGVSPCTTSQGLYGRSLSLCQTPILGCCGLQWFYPLLDSFGACLANPFQIFGTYCTQGLAASMASIPCCPGQAIGMGCPMFGI